MLRKVVIGSVLAGLILLSAYAGPSTPMENLPQYARVVTVIDGDTIELDADGERFTCRLLGVDAPELSYAPLWTEIEKLSKFSRPHQSQELRDAEEVFRRRAETMERHARTARYTLAKTIQGKAVALAYDSTGSGSPRLRGA